MTTQTETGHDVETAIRKIQALELPDVPPAIQKLRNAGALAALTVTDTEAAGYVDDGALTSFVAGLAAQQKRDVLNSTLLAQLAANKAYDREKQTTEWYKKYREVLETVGWVLQEFDFTIFQTSGASFDVQEVVLKLLAAIATQDDIAVVTETLDAMKALSDEDGRVVLFNTASHSFHKGNFQVGAAAESDGVVVMKIGAFHFGTTETVNRLLWLRFSSNVSNMYQGSQTMNLNEQVYAQVRQAVIDKLGANAETYVGNLDI